MGKKKRSGGGSSNKKAERARNAVSDESDGGPVDDGLYDDVDNWDKQKDKLLLQATTAAAGGLQRSGGSGAQREVFVLSGTDSDSDFHLPNVSQQKKNKKKKKKAEKVEEEGLADSDIEEPGEGDRDELRAWGTKKKYFYGGNTGEGQGADSDSSFNEDEAEEREAALLQQRQLDLIQEEDFIDTFTQPAHQSKPKVEEAEVVEEVVKRDLSSFSQKELLALFKQTAPEFDGIVLDFKAKMGEAIRLSRVVSLEDQGLIPPGPLATYIRDKFQLLLNYCTNIICYMMFKAKGTNLKLHPVTARLVQYRQLIDSLGPLDGVAMPQVNDLLERLDQGISIQQAVREERRRLRKRQDRAANKLKKLKILDSKKEASGVETAKSQKTEEKQKKRKLESVHHLDTLTGDERMAVELYQAIKRGRREEEQLEEEDMEKEEEQENTYNGKGDALQEAEEEKRAITYQIAKNKGLTPKRNKLQRNPRVKNRVKFEKAKKRRKGAVREVRTETTRYSGEHFGINARVKKGVKIK